MLEQQNQRRNIIEKFCFGNPTLFSAATKDRKNNNKKTTLQNIDIYPFVYLFNFFCTDEVILLSRSTI